MPPNNEIDLRFEKGVGLLRARKVVEAIPHLAYAAEKQPSYKTLVKLVAAFLAVERFEDALACLVDIESHGWETTKTLIWKG